MNKLLFNIAFSTSEKQTGQIEILYISKIHKQQEIYLQIEIILFPKLIISLAFAMRFYPDIYKKMMMSKCRHLVRNNTTM